MNFIYGIIIILGLDGGMVATAGITNPHDTVSECEDMMFSQFNDTLNALIEAEKTADEPIFQDIGVFCGSLDQLANAFPDLIIKAPTTTIQGPTA